MDDDTKRLFVRDELECDRKKMQGVPVSKWSECIATLSVPITEI